MFILKIHSIETFSFSSFFSFPPFLCNKYTIQEETNISINQQYLISTPWPWNWLSVAFRWRDQAIQSFPFPRTMPLVLFPSLRRIQPLYRVHVIQTRNVLPHTLRTELKSLNSDSNILLTTLNSSLIPPNPLQPLDRTPQPRNHRSFFHHCQQSQTSDSCQTAKIDP